MTVDTNAGPAVTRRTSPLARIDHRYLAPALITGVLIAGQVTFGFLESWSRTFLAIATAILVELVVVRALYGKWPHLASAYVSGISVGILVRSPEFWPYALCAAISITSKYAASSRCCCWRRTASPVSACSGATTSCRWCSCGCSAR
jgi:enediyne biosynthesis protein E5